MEIYPAQAAEPDETRISYRQIFDLIFYEPDQLTPAVLNDMAIHGVHLTAQKYMLILFDFSANSAGLQKQVPPLAAINRVREQVERTVRDEFSRSAVYR